MRAAPNFARVKGKPAAKTARKRPVIVAGLAITDSPPRAPPATSLPELFPTRMNAAVIFRTIGILVILFIMVYVGTENTQAVDFHFSLLLEKPARTSAALVYFAVFAVGMIGGTLLNAGKSGGSAPSRGKDSGSKKK